MRFWITRRAAVAVLSVLGVWLMTDGARAAVKYDLILKNGKVVDGSGAPWYVADVGIRGGKIAKIGRIAAEEAETVIDATGLIVAPGFIDMMGQTATPMMEDPETALNLLTQGITTINAGEGHSAAPLNEADGRKAGLDDDGRVFHAPGTEGPADQRGANRGAYASPADGLGRQSNAGRRRRN